MSTFGQMTANNALAVMAKLLNSDIGAIINKAQRDEVEAYPWSFLLTNTVLYPILPLSLTAVSVGAGNSTVTATCANLGGAVINPPNVKQFITIGGTSNALLPVASWTASGTSITVTLAQPWGGASMSGIGGNLITPIYSMVGYLEIYNVRQITELVKVSREYLNLMDPTRLATGGNPCINWADAGWALDYPNYQIVSVTGNTGKATINLSVPATGVAVGDQIVITGNSYAPANGLWTVTTVSGNQIGFTIGSSGPFFIGQGGTFRDLASLPIGQSPLIELWQPPSGMLPYLVEGKLAAATMVNPTDLPQLPSAVIENKALAMSCYALFASNGNAKYMSLGDKYYSIYAEELEKAKTADVRRTNKNDRREPTPGLDQYATHDFFNPRNA